MVLLFVAGMFFLSFSSKPPENLGVVDGRLAACPDSPNCVSTQTSDASKRMEPIDVSGAAGNVLERVANVINRQPRSRIVEQTDHYLHAEFTSMLFRFVDDVEFFLDDERRQLHFRSASRVGYSDLGANRRRMERLVEEIKHELSK